MKVGLVIMASGLGKRFGGNKLMEILDGKPVIKWILDNTENLFDRRVVVTRHREVKTLCDSQKINCILHDLPNRNDTVRIGLNYIMNDVDYCIFALADQPLIRRESIVELINVAKSNPNMIIRAGFGDVLGAPVGFPKNFFNELINLPQGKGGNYIAKNNPSAVYKVETMYDYELLDIDTVEDLEKIKTIVL